MLFVKCLLCMRLFTCSISFNAENCKEEPLYPPFYREGNRLREVKEVTQDHTTKARIQTQAAWTHRACTYSPAIVSRRGLGAEGRRKERHKDWGCTEKETQMTSPMNLPKPGCRVPPPPQQIEKL